MPSFSVPLSHLAGAVPWWPDRRQGVSETGGGLLLPPSFSVSGPGRDESCCGCDDALALSKALVEWKTGCCCSCDGALCIVAPRSTPPRSIPVPFTGNSYCLMEESICLIIGALVLNDGAPHAWAHVNTRGPMSIPSGRYKRCDTASVGGKCEYGGRGSLALTQSDCPQLGILHARIFTVLSFISLIIRSLSRHFP